MTKMLIDENVPKAVASWLSNRNFQTISVSQTPLKSAKDHIVAEYASKNKMAIVTLDKGFAKIYRGYRSGTLSIILVQVNPPSAANVIEALDLAVRRIDLRETKNNLVVITKKKIRIVK